MHSWKVYVESVRKLRTAHRQPTWVHCAVHLQRFVVYVEMVYISDAHIPMNWRHDPRRPTSSSWLKWTSVRRPELNPQRSKVALPLRVNGATITAGWHCSGRTAASDVCGPQKVWKDHTWDGAAAAGLFKGFIMVYAMSIHIDSENIYPLWNGCGHNGPEVFKERQSETAISSVINPKDLNL